MRFLNLVGTSSSASPSAGCSASPSRTRCAAPRCCGARDYEQIAANRALFRRLRSLRRLRSAFGAAKLGLKISEMPVRYEARRYGQTNIERWRHGLLLLRMVLFAARRIKFV